MSEKPTAAKPAAGKSAEKSKEAETKQTELKKAETKQSVLKKAESKQTELKKAETKQSVLKKAESKELDSLQRKEQTPSKEPMESTKKTAEKVAEAHEMETSSTKMIFIPKTSTSDKPVDPKAKKIPQTPKTTSEETVKSEKSSTSTKSEAPEASKRLEEFCQKYKISSETSSSGKHQILEVQHPEECQMSKISDESDEVPKTKEMSTSIKPEALEVSKVPEERRITTPVSEILIPDQSEDCKVPKTRDMSTSIKPEATEVPKVPEERRISSPVSEILIPDQSEDCKVPKTRDMSTSIKPEATEVPKVPEERRISSPVSEILIPDQSEDCKVPKTRDMSTSTKLEAPEAQKVSEECKISNSDKSVDGKIPKLSTPELNDVLRIVPQIQVPGNLKNDTTSKILEEDESPSICQTSSLPTSKISVSEKEILPKVDKLAKPFPETSATNKTEEPEVSEVRRTSSMSEICTSAKTKEHEVSEVRRTCSETPTVLETTKGSSETPTVLETTKGSKSFASKNDDLETSQMPEEDSSIIDETMDSSVNMGGKIQSVLNETSRKVIQERIRSGLWPPLSAPDFNKSHIVLATYHMVPALPMGLFDVLAEMIEAVTNRPVALMHEKRLNRPFAREVTDIVVMPAIETWNGGDLLPASFVFDHPLNKTNSAEVYVDIVVPKNRSEYINSILDLRGHRCAIPDRRCDLTAAGLLFNHLHSKGENLLFFSSLYETTSQYHVLEMILDKRADVGIVESPVIRCRKDEKTLNVKSLNILQTLGPLPPYRIMVKKPLAGELNDKLAAYLLNASKYDEFMERLLPYGVTGFAKNAEANYQSEYRNIATKVPYY